MSSKMRVIILVSLACTTVFVSGCSALRSSEEGKGDVSSQKVEDEVATWGEATNESWREAGISAECPENVKHLSVCKIVLPGTKLRAPALVLIKDGKREYSIGGVAALDSYAKGDVVYGSDIADTLSKSLGSYMGVPDADPNDGLTCEDLDALADKATTMCQMESGWEMPVWDMRVTFTGDKGEFYYEQTARY